MSTLQSDLLLSRLDALTNQHGPHHAARTIAAELTTAELQAYALPYLIALARRTAGPEGVTTPAIAQARAARRAQLR